MIEAGRRQVNASFQNPSLAMVRADTAQGHAVEKRLQPLDVLGLAFGGAGRERVPVYIQPVAGQNAETGVGVRAIDEVGGLGLEIGEASLGQFPVTRVEGAVDSPAGEPSARFRDIALYFPNCSLAQQTIR